MVKEGFLYLNYRAIKSEDPRMVWLKNQYLFFYYQDDLCMGPLAADAITVRTQSHYPNVFSRNIMKLTQVKKLCEEAVTIMFLFLRER